MYMVAEKYKKPYLLWPICLGGAEEYEVHLELSLSFPDFLFKF